MSRPQRITAQGDSWTAIAGASLATVAIGALLLSGSPAVTSVACAACGAVFCVASITRAEWRKRQDRRTEAPAAGKHACGKPEKLNLTDADRLLLDVAFLVIIALNHDEGEIDALQRRGEVLRVNRRRS